MFFATSADTLTVTLQQQRFCRIYHLMYFSRSRNLFVLNTKRIKTELALDGKLKHIYQVVTSNTSYSNFLMCYNKHIPNIDFKKLN